MGVKDLWQLLAPVGRRVSIESLEGKVLAIDMSIWLTQFIKAMRDEDGKMMKNAHLIGTLRRMLKLLFHRIRPVFVFDGKTPALKERVMRMRRKTLEKHESDRKAAIQKIILSQLKRQAAQQLQSQCLPQASKEYASTFNAPQTALRRDDPAPAAESALNTSIRSSMESSSAAAGEEQDEGDDIQWMPGYEHLKAKALDEEDENIDEEDDRWGLPEDHSQLNPEVLSSLPPHIRKSIVLEARRKERARARSHYIPVAGNPQLYSQTQLANFLQTSKLNKRFEEAQKMTDGGKEGRSIAADGRKKYKMLPHVLSSIEPSDSHGKPAGSSKAINHDDSSDDEFTSRDWVLPAADQAPGVASRPRGRACVEDENEDEESELGGGGGFLLEAEEPSVKDPAASKNTAIPTVLTNDVVDLTGSYSLSPQAPTMAPTLLASAPPRDEPVASGVLSNYYADFHADDSGTDGGCDDIEWEAEEGSAVYYPSASPVTETWDPRSEVAAEAQCESQFEVVLIDECDVTGLSRSPSPSLLPSPSPSPRHVAEVPPAGETRSVKLESSALDRAVETASKMADWAGRAVWRALKEHVEKPLSNSGIVDEASMEGAATAAPLASVDDSQTKISGNDGSRLWEPPASNGGDAAERAEHHRVTFTLPADAYDLGSGNEETVKRLAAANRDTERLTDEMKDEVMQLIRAFDLPYLVAPFEAEAQCAVLEQLGLVDGVITEDSDTFLFGSCAVYKNIFNDRKYVEVYLAEDAKRELGLSRDDLIALAFFLGSDYTEGVHGIGMVNAMEIVQAFPMKAEQGGPVKGLSRFKQWLEGYDFAKEILDGLDQRKEGRLSSKAKKVASDDTLADEQTDDLSAEERRLVAFSNKHRTGRSKWTLPEAFPDCRVIDAYMEPQADRRTERFSWPPPTRSKVRDFCKHILGWTDMMMDAQIDPVLVQFSSRPTQTRIDSHFTTYHDNARFAKIASDRLRDAVVKITGKDTDLALAAPVRKRRRQAPEVTESD